MDDEGNPFYAATVYQKKQFGLGVPRPSSVIILDATDGETKEYSLDESRMGGSCPIRWKKPSSKSTTTASIRRLLECLDFKKNVTQTTEGYNYLSIGNDIYLYTGVTSANADESNQVYPWKQCAREITKYNLASATEESARASQKEQCEAAHEKRDIDPR